MKNMNNESLLVETAMNNVHRAITAGQQAAHGVALMKYAHGELR